MKGRGAVPSQVIKQIIRSGFISGISEEYVNPASLDLPTSEEIYEVDSVFQPKPGEAIKDCLKSISVRPQKISEPLRCGRTYLSRILGSFCLKRVALYGYTNPKSTTGRTDTHVRVLADFVPSFDTLRLANEFWSGTLWQLICPKSMDILIYPGLALAQARLFNSDTRIGETSLRALMESLKFLWTRDGSPMSYEKMNQNDQDGSIVMSLGLEKDVVGWETIHTSKVFDFCAPIGSVDPRHFFRPIYRDGEFITLRKDSFYILGTREAIRIPSSFACEFASLDDRVGDFRNHYAGYFDPGWGWGENGEGKGRIATLEVRPFENIRLRHGQTIVRAKIEHMAEEPESSYDQSSTGSSYVLQSGAKLAKQFKEISW